MASPRRQSARWRRSDPHEVVLRIGPVLITVSRWTSAATSRTDGVDVWSWMATIGESMILRGHHRGAGAPLERCKSDAIAARYLEGLSIRQIAAALGVGVATVNRALRRAGVELRPPYLSRGRAA